MLNINNKIVSIKIIFENKFVKIYLKMKYLFTVKPLYSGHPSDFSKVSTIRRCHYRAIQLFSRVKFFEAKHKFSRYVKC